MIYERSWVHLPSTGTKTHCSPLGRIVANLQVLMRGSGAWGLILEGWEEKVRDTEHSPKLITFMFSAGTISTAAPVPSPAPDFYK